MNEDHDSGVSDSRQSDSGAGANQADNQNPRRGHCFFIKDIELLTKLWECAGCNQRFNKHVNYNRHVTGGTCGGGKTKLICPGEKFERIMNSSEIVFYGGKKNFSYAACHWIEKQSELIGEHIHHALCGHGGEFSVTIGKKKILLMDMNRKQELFFNITGVNGTGVHVKKKEIHLTKKDTPKQ